MSSLKVFANAIFGYRQNLVCFRKEGRLNLLRLDQLAKSKDARNNNRSIVSWKHSFLLILCAFNGCLALAVGGFAQTPNWTQQFPTTSPAARTEYAMVYDVARGQTVIFGGVDINGALLGDTWVWDGENWTQKFPASSPPPTVQSAAAYDAARGRVVLFGGDTAIGGFLGTWLWDGTNWTEASPSVTPSARYGAAMAYDSARSEVVLFGGADISGTILGDTWIWDGATWLQKIPAANPPARLSHAIAYDAARGNLLLFGGADATTVFGDTWIWDGTDWTQKSPPESPAARTFHAMEYDVAHQQVILFGGEVGPPFVITGDTWTWNGTVWTQLEPATSPSPRREHKLAYDSAHSQVVLFGGDNGPSDDELDDTWVFSAAGSSPVTLVVASTDPASGVAVTASPSDLNGQVAGTTEFTLSYAKGSTVTLDAAASVGANGFANWTGCDFILGRACTVTIQDNHMVTANYTTPTGTLTVTTNLSRATFAITGPVNLTGSGTSATFNTAPIGTYTITFGTVNGYVTPAPQTQTLITGGALTFTGIYNPAVGKIDVTTNTGSATFTITGPVSLSGNGNSASFTNLPPGSYTITYGPGCRADLPQAETKRVSSAATTTFVGNYAPGFLSFPLASLDPCSAHINAIFDHSQTVPYTNDLKVVAYTGETGFCNPNNSAQDFQSVVGVKHPHSGYRNQTGSAFAVNSNYTGGENGHGSPTLTCASTSAANLPSDTFLFYDGHPGYDYQARCGTPVYAAASGTVSYPVSIPGLSNAETFHVLELDPDSPNSAYKLYYLHLSSYPPSKYPSCKSAPPIIPRSCNGKRCHVTAGQLIGMSGDAGVPGSPHLHFEVQRNPGIPVDPYGWKGTPGADPYKRAINTNLWQ